MKSVVLVYNTNIPTPSLGVAFPPIVCVGGGLGCKPHLFIHPRSNEIVSTYCIWQLDHHGFVVKPNYLKKGKYII